MALPQVWQHISMQLIGIAEMFCGLSVSAPPVSHLSDSVL